MEVRNIEEISLKEYVNNLGEAISISLGRCELYHGKKGCLRLAREFADGLKDYEVDIIRNLLGITYGIIVVKGYSLKPPISNKEWINEIRKRLYNKYNISL